MSEVTVARKLVLGIDPGLKGGIAVHIDTDIGSYWRLIPLPITQIGNNRAELDLDAFIGIIKVMTSVQPVRVEIAAVENPPIVPGNGVLAYRSLFKAYGEIRGVLRALDIPLTLPTPQCWKAKILANTDKDKDAAIQHVLTRYPRLQLPKLGPRSKKYHDGLADAVCLAEYGMQIMGIDNSHEYEDGLKPTTPK